ncbi:hypothetical protein [Azotobacter vinelandii]|uniref:hypothetical protein n=1 Tax=Azotobacter vinelandii TaxID=354 RepID=UPI002666EB34|nr:hypothetical protein [Azotobacter vinelandii]WKN20850.1 hypothetical protein AVAEIV_003876 [Azotobacter vinelandii]
MNLIEALNGGKGALDAWLETKSEGDAVISAMGGCATNARWGDSQIGLSDGRQDARRAHQVDQGGIRGVV